MATQKPIMTLGELAAWLAEGAKATPADLAPMCEGLRALDPALVAAVVAPIVAGLTALHERASAAGGVTNAEMQIVHGLAHSARLWSTYLLDPATLHDESGAQ